MCKSNVEKNINDFDGEVESENYVGRVNVNVVVNSIGSENNLSSKGDVRNSGYNGDNGNEEKVTICHNGNTIEVAESAVQAHLDHGDTLGPCEEIIIADVKFIDTNDELEVDSDDS